jgi:hypothetical protein
MNPPGFIVRVIICPVPVIVIDWVDVLPFTVKVTAYVPGGSVKVTNPCEFVTACNCPERHGVTDAGVSTTLAPETGLPWLSTTLIVTVTFAGQTGVMVDEKVVVTAVVDVETVDTTVDVEVVMMFPPKGAN